MTRRSCLAAAAGIHGGDQLETGPVGDVVVCACYYGFTGFQGLAQRFEDTRLELRQLIEEKHAIMSQGHLARARSKAAADECRSAGGVMGCSKRPSAGEPAACKFAG